MYVITYHYRGNTSSVFKMKVRAGKDFEIFVLNSFLPEIDRIITDIELV